MTSTTCRTAWIFQSTPPARGATPDCPESGRSDADFNPRPPRGGRLAFYAALEAVGIISIHAPREGGDETMLRHYQDVDIISIHAPREGGDSKDAQFYLWIFDK